MESSICLRPLKFNMDEVDDNLAHFCKPAASFEL